MMPLYAFDSDTVSLLLRGNAVVSRRTVVVRVAQRALPIVTVQEMLAGWLPILNRVQPAFRYVAAYSEFRRALDLARLTTILDFDSVAAAEYSRLRHIHRRMGTNDLRIAAIALSAGAVLVTCNTQHFGQIEGLAVEDWSRQ